MPKIDNTVLIYLGSIGLGIEAIIIVKMMKDIVLKLTELTDKLSTLIQVTYQATHDPNFECQLTEMRKEQNEEDNQDTEQDFDKGQRSF